MEKSLTPEQLAQFNPLKSKLNSLGHKIKTITEQGRTVVTDIANLHLFKGMYKELKPYFDNFNDVWDKLIELMALWGVSVFPTKEDKTLQQAVERYYYEANAVYEQYMNPTPQRISTQVPTLPPAQNTTINDSRTVRARLPQINLPSFSGNQTEWPLFRDTYRSLIHNEDSLSDIEKFLFLISCLKGPALTLIKGIQLEEANYPQAWKLLNDTYNDKRRLASNYLTTILEFTPFKSRPSANGLKHLLTTVGESIESFKQLNIPAGEDFILFSLILRCLDSDTRRAFEKQHSAIEFPTYKNLIDFIKVEWRALELSSEDTNCNSQPRPNQQSSHRGNKYQAKSLLVNNRTSTNSSASNKLQYSNSSNPTRIHCPACKMNHTLYQCTRFKAASPVERVAFLKNWTGCLNCLSSKHSINNCTSQRRCQSCAQNHHTWLHVTYKTQNHQSQEQPIQSTSATSAPSTSGITLGSLSHQGSVLLGTAIIEVQDAHGDYQKIRAVTDSGSQHSFITEDCSKRLGLTIRPWNQKISGIGQSPLTGMSGKTNCQIRSAILSDAQSNFNIEAIVVSRITGDLPHTVLKLPSQALYKSYVLADEEFWKPGPVEFLLGGDLFYDIVTGRPISVDPDAPRLLPTLFGYIIAGPSKGSSISDSASSFFIQTTQDIQQTLLKFWEVEEVPKRQVISEEEQKCEAHFASTHYRLDTGRYVVSLPVKESIKALENPSQQAMSRLKNLENKLEKDPLLKEEYHKFMKEYLTLGHMKLAPPGTSAYTIPHHAVTKTSNGQTKLRVVFDASCNSKAGSLNDNMYAGPKLQLDIGDVITNFRTHQFVFTADIVKMYRQILVGQADRKYQHILWRFNQAESIQEYELCTVTYGEKASAFLAQRTIRQLVSDDGEAFSLAAKALLEDIYVDDIATGAQTLTEAIRLKEELIILLSKGGFKLSKWASNCPTLLTTFNQAELSDSCITLSDEEHSKVKLLGIQWNPNEDVFSYEICTPPWKPTKRAILSAIARIYDPLGYLSPVIFFAKVLLQEMWAAKVGWDDIGPYKTRENWRVFLNQLPCLSKIKLPRCITSTEATSYILVGFSDASQRGYSAVLYLRTVTPNGCQILLLKAKTKLAPIKPMTIPRLELSGALLLCRLVQGCKGLMSRLKVNDVKLFTDSQVVLGWLSTPPEELNTFVTHRVIEILDHTRRNQWNFVTSEENPADCSSRGLLPSELSDHPLWWTGPPWLLKPEHEWPVSSINPCKELPELKKRTTASLTTTTDFNILDWMDRFSSYMKLLRCTAYLLRFIKRRKEKTKRTGPILASEYKNAANILIKLIQSCYRSPDGLITNSKSLRSLRLFLAEDGLIRVGGRIQNSSLPFDAKHPILIPANCHFTKIMIDYYHKTYLHLGPSALQAMLQAKFWIPGARRLIRQRVFNCITCYKATRSPQPPLMGNLPSCRFDESQPFCHVGVDLAGPFFIRESSRRKAALGKAYLCLFICMTTKAVHLELVSKCSTDAFLAAFQRFVSRRGKPAHVYSDCGTNFVGAANRLRGMILLLRSKEAQDQIVNEVAPQQIQWSFNPPSAPHFGGLWEAGVKSCKSILYKVIGETTLTFEELSTLFIRIEGILNSRPLVPTSSDPESIDCLTPGHLLIGRPITALPEEPIPSNITIARRWNLIQQKAQHFWARWRLEYLNLLQQRKKWNKEKRNLRVGDLVVIKEPNSLMKVWPLARILEVHPGNDGVVRVATLRTATGTYKRPVSKLVSLIPVNDRVSD